MALVYFLDPNDAPVATGDAYATLEEVDMLLNASAATCAYTSLDRDARETLIKAVSKKLDLLDYKGEPVDAAQPLTFPLKGLYDLTLVGSRAEKWYSVATQKKKLLQAVAIQIEADTQKGSIAQASISQKSESVVDRMFDIHPLAKAPLSRFMLKG